NRLHRDGSLQLLYDPTLFRRAADAWATGFVDSFELAGFVHHKVRVDADTRNGLGVGYLSRYVVTVDFPHHRLFLKQGRAYDRVDRVDHSGITIARRDGHVEVYRVWAGSPAADAGVLEL